MIDYLMDTDIFSLYMRRLPKLIDVMSGIQRDTMALTIITADEVWSGWKKAVLKAKSEGDLAYAYFRLTDAQLNLAQWNIVTFSVDAIRLTDDLRKQKLNIGANDLKIAAIAMTLDATVVTRNLRDFSRVPNLKIEDWTQ